MLQIHYFASVREALGRGEEQLELPAGVTTVAELVGHLREADAAFDRLHEGSRPVLVAVNQVVANRLGKIADGDEIAFFPPMSGG